MKRLVKAYQTYGGGSPEHLAALARYELKAYGTTINGKPRCTTKSVIAKAEGKP